MKKKEFNQIKTMPEADLKKQTNNLREKLWNLKKDLAAGKVKNVREIRSTKKDIAKIMTILNQKNG